MQRLLITLIAFSMGLSGQTNSGIARHITYGAVLPATCSPATGDVFFLTSAGPTGALYTCTAVNTWTAAGGGGGSQTPWTSNINGGGYNLSNVGAVSVSNTFPNGGGASSIVLGGGLISPFNNAHFVFFGDSRICGTGATSGSLCGSTPAIIGSTGYAAVTTGTASVNSTALTVASGSGTINGQGVYGVGIAPNTTVSSGGGTTSIVLSLPTVSALSTTAVSFGNMDYPSQAMRLPVFSGHGTGYNDGFSGLTCSQLAGQYTVTGGAHSVSPAITGNPGYIFINCGTNGEGPNVTQTATGTSGQPSIVVSSQSGIDVGQTVTGTGIGANAKVASTYTGGTTIPLTVANSGTVSGTITFTTTVASVANSTANLWALARADGYKVIASTNPNHATASVTRNLNDSYNNLIRASGGSWDYIMDLQADLEDEFDLNYFYTDNTHFTNEGYQVWAQHAAAALITPGNSQFGMAKRRYASIGTGTGITRYPSTCAYVLTNGGNNTCFGYGSMPVLTTGSFNSSFGDNNLTALVGGSANLAIGHGIGDNLVSGGSNVLLGGDTNSDVSFGVSVGIGCSVTGGSGVCVGHNAVAGSNAFAVGGGTSSTASGSVNIDPVGATTNSTANTFAYHGYSFITTTGVLTQSGATSCATGVVTNSSGTFTGCVASDRRLKTHIVAATFDAISIISKLKTFDYEWKDSSARDAAKHYGFIAQDVKAVFPRASVKAGTAPDGSDLLGVDPVAMAALAIKGEQELQKEVDDLKADIAALRKSVK